MYRIHQIKLPVGESKDKIPEKILKKIGGRDLFIKEWEIVKESIDARDKSNLCWVYSVDFNVASRKNPKKNLRLSQKIFGLPDRKVRLARKKSAACPIEKFGLPDYKIYSVRFLPATARFKWAQT